MSQLKNSLLWEISLMDCEFTTYLFGTIHLRSAKAYTHIDKALTFLEKCSLIALEYDLSTQIDVNPMKYFLLETDISLEKLLSGKYEKIRSILMRAFEVDIDQYKGMIPMAILNSISESIFDRDHTVTLDQHLYDKARQIGIPITGVETMQDQLRTLEKIPLDYQLKALKGVAANPKKYRKNLKALLQMYIKEEVHALYRRSKKDLGGIRKLLLYDRNKVMARSIIELAIDNSTFIAIGAAHLSGKRGVIHLLKTKGVEVRSVAEA